MAIKFLKQSMNSAGSVANSRLNWKKALQTLVGNASEIRPDDISPRDAIIAVMGPTGTGKSTFIETICGISGISGHGLESCTERISVVRLSLPDYADFDLCFVDTPGFDDTNKSDVEIFKMISEWLNNTYKTNIKLDGLLYFHRISDNRMGGTPLKNLRLFETLCGKDYNKIVFTTTMWDDVDEETGSKREGELKDAYWKTMIARGSSVRRFRCTRESALNVLAPIFDEINVQSALLLQKEVTDLGMKLSQTTAGRVLYLELEQLVSRHQAVLEKIRKELKEPFLDEKSLCLLMEEYNGVTTQLQRASEDKRLMHISWFRRALTWKPSFRVFAATKSKTDTLAKQDQDREVVSNGTEEGPGVLHLTGSDDTSQVVLTLEGDPSIKDWLVWQQYVDSDKVHCPFNSSQEKDERM